MSYAILLALLTRTNLLATHRTAFYAICLNVLQIQLLLLRRRCVCIHCYPVHSGTLVIVAWISIAIPWLSPWTIASIRKAWRLAFIALIVTWSAPLVANLVQSRQYLWLLSYHQHFCIKSVSLLAIRAVGEGTLGWARGTLGGAWRQWHLTLSVIPHHPQQVWQVPYPILIIRYQSILLENLNLVL